MDSALTVKQWRLALQTDWTAPWLVVAVLCALAAVALAAWGYRRRSLAVITALSLLRLLTVSAVLLVALQPSVHVRSVTQVPNHIAVLIDTSQSMALKGGDGHGQQSRIDRAAAVVEASAGRLNQWRRTRRVEVFGFDERLQPVDPQRSALPATGVATRVRAALEQLRQRYQGNDLAGVVLISDGIDNGRLGTGKLSASQRGFVRGFGAPIHTLWVGRGAIRDVSVGPVFADDFAFVRNAVTVEVEVGISGMDLDSVPLTLSQGDRVIARELVDVPSAKGRVRARLSFVPQRVGKYVYTVATPVQRGEAIKHNNQRSFTVRVIRDRIRVLQICGQPSWDQRFLRRLLKRDPNVDLISFFILRTPASVSLVPSRELSLIPFPTQELFERQLGSFDLVILQNFNFGPYGIGTYLPQLKRYVEQGGGLVMVGGPLSFSSGGYPGTPVAEVLPVALLPAAWEPSQLLSEADFRMHITDRGWNHPLLQFGRTRKETAAILERLPPLSGANLVGGRRQQTTVLATHPRLRTPRGQPMPVLATRRVGRGRTLALATDSLWRWAFEDADAGSSRGVYDRFWRNAIRWLINDPELQYLRIIVYRDVIRGGTPAKISIRAYQPDYSPSKGTEVQYAIESIDKRNNRTVHTGRGQSDERGEIHVTYGPVPAGAYRVTARAVIGEQERSASEIFLVEPASLEARDPQATDSLLKQLAAVSGGQYLGSIHSLPDLNFLTPRVKRVNWQREYDLWNRWWSLLAVIVLLTVEWLARRRLGYL